MFEKFRNCFCIDRTLSVWDLLLSKPTGDVLKGDADLTHFMDEFSGASYNSGLYRVLDLKEVPEFVARITSVFPGYEARIFPFAYDWLNRVYCLDVGRAEGSQPILLLFSHLTDEVLSIPSDILNFHDEILIDKFDEVLESRLFDSFLQVQQKHFISRKECAGMVVPLFLGGSYSAENMTIVDIEVDWQINGLLLNQTRSLRAGTQIKGVVILPPDTGKD